MTTLQINVGKLCNQACHHCHVEAGPKRTEIMRPEIADRIVNLLVASPSIQIVDITGGAPELNPNFARLVLLSRALGHHVIDRCNLTVFFEPGQEVICLNFLPATKWRLPPACHATPLKMWTNSGEEVFLIRAFAHCSFSTNSDTGSLVLG